MIRSMTIDSEGGRPSSGGPVHSSLPSRSVVILAAGASAVVVGTAALGAFTPVVAVGAACAACWIAVLSWRHSGRGVVADILPPLSERFRGPAIVDAPRASQVAGRTDSRTDAA